MRGQSDNHWSPRHLLEGGVFLLGHRNLEVSGGGFACAAWLFTTDLLACIACQAFPECGHFMRATALHHQCWTLKGFCMAYTFRQACRCCARQTFTSHGFDNFACRAGASQKDGGYCRHQHGLPRRCKQSTIMAHCQNF